MLRWITFAGVAVASIAGVSILGRRDSADPARCAGLVAMGNRCCAEGQIAKGGLCVGRPTSCPPPLAITQAGCAAPLDRVVIAGGLLRTGAGDWEAEGRVAVGEVWVRPFAIDAVEITEESYAHCATSAGCVALPSSGEPGRAQAKMARAEAEAYCAFRGGRLPTSDEWAFAAAGANARRYPWGDTGAVCRRASWGLKDGPCGFGHTGPELAGLHPQGATPEGIFDLAGNVSEWVAGAAGDADGVVRGGSFAAELATDLRTWRAVRVPVNTRSAELGARCAYDVPNDTP
jgi:formylglycine-generating enzyme